MSEPAIVPRNSPARRRNFERLLAPGHIAFVGSQVEYHLKNLVQKSFAGKVEVVHPKRTEIAGFPCIASLDHLSGPPDATFIAVNADATIGVLNHLRRMDAGGAICYASGFSEIGAAGAQRHLDFVAAAGEMAVVGPNCYGLVNYVNHGSMWPSPYPDQAGTRGAAVISQSGNVTAHFVSNGRSVPFSYLISAGNQGVLGFEDYIDHLVDDPNVTCLGLFMEGIRDVPAFSQACLRARAAGMPVIVCRSGRSELGASMAASHTSSLAGRNDYYDALFNRLGVIQTDTVPQFLEMLKLASLAPPLAGPRLAVFSSSGGDNGLAADYCSFAGLDLPQPTAAQVATIKPALPEFGHVSNPLDFTAGYWGSERLLTPMFTTMLQGDYDAGMLVIEYPATGITDIDTTAQEAMDRALANAAKASGKPVFHASVNSAGISAKASAEMVAQGIVPLQGLHDAAAVIAKWVDHSARQRRDRAAGPAALTRLIPYRTAPVAGARCTVNEALSKARLKACGLPVPEGKILTRATMADLSERFQAPMVLKVLHDDLPHKTEVGGVALKLHGRADVEAAADRMLDSVARAAPQVKLEQFLLEPMQSPPLAELIVGVQNDPLFGMVLVIGAGGILVELLQDATPLLLPTDRGAIEQALRGLKSFALLDGFRGRPAANLEPVIDAIEAVARYAGENLDRLIELDVNPLMVSENGVVAVDALIVETGG